MAWERALCAATDLTVSRGELQQTVGSTWLLVYEELASNAVRHGRLPVCVRVVAIGRGWFVDVTDATVHRPPVPAVDRDPADGGLGLYLVGRLCRAHGWTVDEVGASTSGRVSRPHDRGPGVRWAGGGQPGLVVVPEWSP
jgi:hypothetical protein